MSPAAFLPAQQEMFLLYGPRDAYDDAFADENEVVAAWEQHRERILESHQPGRRPWAWRAIDRPDLPWRGYARERSGLWRAGILSIAERAEVEAEWRAEFAKAQRPGFMHVLGQGRILTGAAARTAHYRAMDIPNELLREWRVRHRRPQKEQPRNEVAQGR